MTESSEHFARVCALLHQKWADLIEKFGSLGRISKTMREQVEEQAKSVGRIYIKGKNRRTFNSVGNTPHKL